MRYRIRETIASAFGAVIVALALLAAPAPTIAAPPIKWPVVASPNNGTSDNVFNGVSCPTATFCAAVGQYRDTGLGVLATLVESWNGTAWTIVSSPTSPTTDSGLNGVSCASASSCIAVGFYLDGSGFSRTLIEKWDGTSWTAASSPNASSASNSLSGVSCASAGSCTAVGSYDTGSSLFQTLIEQWDGTNWSLAASPNSGTSHNYLHGVSCPSATFCTAVGDFTPSSGPEQTLIETWGGTAWSIASSSNAFGSNFLYGVTCLSSTSCTAVGAAGTFQSFRTLAES